ncbi:hypothetical protein M5E06_26645 [Azospirillum sp. A1-3]|uniref:hypothetical protein n=1 Tax=Azospirillum sp. A1-3 TaxID=185874 RepID=UPI0020778ACD|nr:hypothetical protein [Azospirillum sp. A1-3]MCM8737704.1 hypothetical protein [Azospirillum sp. A1-3]
MSDISFRTLSECCARSAVHFDPISARQDFRTDLLDRYSPNRRSILRHHKTKDENWAIARNCASFKKNIELFR